MPWDLGYLPGLLVFMFTSLCIKLPFFYFYKIYNRFWPYASIDAMLLIVKSVIISSALVMVVFFAIQSTGVFAGFNLPRSLPFIDGLLTLVVVGGSRFSVRAMEYYRSQLNKQDQASRVLIAGAGDAGQIVAREIYSSRHLSLDLFGFVDDNPEKIGTNIHGVLVYGPLEKIPELVRDYKIDEIIIAIPTAPGHVIRRIVNACDIAGIPSRTLPGIYELITGKVSVNKLREVEIEDLLRREPVKIDFDQVTQLLAGKPILVTGAGGSIGSELCVQITRCMPGQLIVLGHGENSLYALKSRFAELEIDDSKLEVVIADIRDRHRLELLFSRYRPEIIFHAAAHKHVPLMEENIDEAVTNNIIGTWNLAQMSKKYDVAHFVLISTDKAVNPVNVMGMTKRMAETIVRRVAAETNRPYVTVRFGNVLGSRGSIIPLFTHQIASGGPVTITHPDMVRFFMTIPEAVQLVLQASALGHNAEVFVLDMGEPIKIVDLARDMIELSGYEVGREIKIEYTGLRPGERLNEFLFTEDENFTQTKHEKIFVARNGLIPSYEDLELEIETLESLAKTGQTDDLLLRLRHLTAGEE